MSDLQEGKIQQLRAELAAAHKQYEKLAVASVEQGKQLVAERELEQSLREQLSEESHKLIKAREQLAAEREKRKEGDAPCPTSQSSSTNTDVTPLGSNAALTFEPEVRQLRAQLAAAVEAFRKLHLAWLSAGHRCDMNEQMDELGKVLGLDAALVKIGGKP